MKKVICTGWHRTGVTSLCEALNQLGIRSTREPWNHYNQPIDSYYLDVVMQHFLPQYQGFADMPWNYLFPIIDNYLNGQCVFIHTMRDPEKWYDSAYRLFAKSGGSKTERLLYEGPVQEKDLWINRYTFHNRFVQYYFNNNPTRCLLLDTSELSWGPIIQHLNNYNIQTLEPQEDFPWENKTIAGGDH
jgi:hypothetical protein